MGTHDGKGMAALGAPCECFWVLQHRLRAFGTHFVHFAAAESTVQASRGWQELARWGLGLCLDHQYV